MEMDSAGVVKASAQAVCLSDVVKGAGFSLGTTTLILPLGIRQKKKKDFSLSEVKLNMHMGETLYVSVYDFINVYMSYIYT